MMKNEHHISPPKFIALSHNGGYLLSEIHAIIHCESDGNYTSVFLKNGKRVMVCRKLKDIEKILSGNSFVRVHHSHLVNLEYVEKYIKGDGGQVVLANGKVIDVARRRRKDLFERLIVI